MDRRYGRQKRGNRRAGPCPQNLRLRRQIRLMQDEGLDMTHWRRLLRAAVEETDKPQVRPGTDEQLPNADCPDMDEWGIMIETIQSFVLWDAGRKGVRTI
jgi:hypothetical protein